MSSCWKKLSGKSPPNSLLFSKRKKSFEEHVHYESVIPSVLQQVDWPKNPVSSTDATSFNLISASIPSLFHAFPF